MLLQLQTSTEPSFGIEPNSPVYKTGPNPLQALKAFLCSLSEIRTQVLLACKASAINHLGEETVSVLVTNLNHEQQ